MAAVCLLIGGEFVESGADEHVDVTNPDKLAENITTEQGKTLKDAWGDVFRGLEVVEHACGMGTLQMGEYVSNVSNGIDTFSIREPLGVCAGICPFNFPAMIPLWMFPIAVTCGNTFVLKPSEKDPGAAMMPAELAMEAGLPNWVQFAKDHRREPVQEPHPGEGTDVSPE
ncbi:unnamed protein product [Miscanthus lutarioriparius]|uniref:Aldehyde dehydrogenase domain-containing protein n=1 Tax=Miscanthus lutarioriparius TaxID=422564 RepID=A0A811SJH1_9POAL|nr:unnamed protein product [Miscanthus lutarioriparius]